MDKNDICTLQAKIPMVPKKLMHGASLEHGDRMGALRKYVPKGGKIVEVGTLSGWLRRQILKDLKPSLLVVIDLDEGAIRMCEKEHSKLIALGTVRCVLGNSNAKLAELEEETFDLIYVDGHHGYSIVCADMEAARGKIKPGGLMVMNDYYLFETLFLGTTRLAGRWAVYGVIHATNEFIIRYRWTVVYMTLQSRLEPDLAIRKPWRTKAKALPAGATGATP